MNITRRIVFATAASWFSRGVTIVFGLVLLPVLFRNLPKEELGVWLLLGQSWAALGIFDLGFGVTLTRRIAFARGRDGGDPSMPLTTETISDVGDLVATGRRVYHVLAFATFVLSWGAGFIYFGRLELHSISLTTMWLAWGILCLSQAVGVWATVWACLLQGMGYVGWDAILTSIVNAVTLLVQIVVVFLEGGLVSLAVVAALGAVTQRWLVIRSAHRKRPELLAMCGRWNSTVLRSMISPALRAWFTALGATMILYTDQILIASHEGTIEIPAYRAAFVLIHNVTIVAVSLGAASSVFISHLWQTADLTQVRRIVERNARLGWLTMLSGAACILVAGEPLFALWLGPGNFVGYPIIVAFLIAETLETQSYIIATASRATEDEAFAVPAIIGGVLKLALSWWLAKKFGLLGIALGTTIALLLTNHWYMVYRGLRRLQIPLREYVIGILFPSVWIFPLMLGILTGISHFLAAASAPVQVLSVASATLALFGLAVWSLVLEPAQRSRIGRVLRFA